VTARIAYMDFDDHGLHLNSLGQLYRQTGRHIMRRTRSFQLIFPSQKIVAMQLELFDAQMLAPLVQYLNRNGARCEAFLDRARIPGELIAKGGWSPRSKRTISLPWSNW